MPKNIVILLDGTSNQIEADRTNILRLYGVLEKSDDQLVYYDPGVGTLADEDSFGWIRRKTKEVMGLALGLGLDANVKQAYRFLIDHYDDGKRSEVPDEGRDQIYILGFSRGAYTARVLAGFIHTFGLIQARNENLLDYAYRAYKRIGEKASDSAFAEMRLYERILSPDRPPIRMLGLFDTVASVIESGRRGIRLKSHAHTSTNHSVQSVFHAVSADERRTMFTPQLWPAGGIYSANRFNTEKAVPQEVKEVWFPGAHGDIGGGYPEAESGLCKVPLAWMIENAKRSGLKVRTQTVNSLVFGKPQGSKYVAPDPDAPAHNTMTLAWSILEFLPRRQSPLSKRVSVMGWTIPFFERRAIPEGATVHSSVLARNPPNLPGDYRVEIESRDRKRNGGRTRVRT